MAADEVNLAVAYDYVSFLQLQAGRADGFDFPAFELDSRLEFLLDEVVVEGFLVLRDAHVRV